MRYACFSCVILTVYRSLIVLSGFGNFEGFAFFRRLCLSAVVILEKPCFYNHKYDGFFPWVYILLDRTPCEFDIPLPRVRGHAGSRPSECYKIVVATGEFGGGPAYIA